MKCRKKKSLTPIWIFLGVVVFISIIVFSQRVQLSYADFVSRCETTGGSLFVPIACMPDENCVDYVYCQCSDFILTSGNVVESSGDVSYGGVKSEDWRGCSLKLGTVVVTDD